MKLLALLQGKIVLTVAAGALLVGGATAVFAATPAGQNVVHSLTHTTVTAVATHGDHDGKHDGTPDQDHKACPGQEDAAKLAASYHLSTSEQGPSVMAICALHQGTFKGTTPAGVAVTSSRVYGYGEIDQLLTYAQFLAGQDKANVGGKLTDANVSSYLAAALHGCGSSPLETCLKNNIPNFHPGNGDHGDGKDNKPTTTPTPNGNKPTSTPTPHH